MIMTVLLKALSVIRDAAKARRLLRIISCLLGLSSLPGGIALAGPVYREGSEASSAGAGIILIQNLIRFSRYPADFGVTVEFVAGLC